MWAVQVRAKEGKTVFDMIRGNTYGAYHTLYRGPCKFDQREVRQYWLRFGAVHIKIIALYTIISLKSY